MKKELYEKTELTKEEYSKKVNKVSVGAVFFIFLLIGILYVFNTFNNITSSWFEYIGISLIFTFGLMIICWLIARLIVSKNKWEKVK